jgi:hypothetical protein
MKSRTLTCIASTSLFVALSVIVRLAAQERPEQKGQDKAQPRYTLVDLGTFGGPISILNDGNPPLSQVLNSGGRSWVGRIRPFPIPTFQTAS